MSKGLNVETSHSTQPTMAKLWNLNSTIPGYIAFAAIMVCWQIIMYNTQTYVFS